MHVQDSEQMTQRPFVTILLLIFSIIFVTSYGNDLVDSKHD